MNPAAKPGELFERHWHPCPGFTVTQHRGTLSDGWRLDGFALIIWRVGVSLTWRRAPRKPS